MTRIAARERYLGYSFIKISDFQILYFMLLNLMVFMVSSDKIWFGCNVGVCQFDLFCCS